MTTLSLPDLSTPYSLTPEQLARFQRSGYIKLKNVFTGNELKAFREEITSLVKKMAGGNKPLSERDTYGKAFLQVMNLWTTNHEIVKTLVFAPRLARIATELLQTRGVRLYHDQALYKEAGGGYTPWHVDQQYWPFESDRTITAWIPLHPVPVENGTLSFASGSQQITYGRDLEISDESEKLINQHLKLSDFPIDETPYDLGEVSFHLGYTFHRAGPNKLPTPREVMTVIYIDKDIRLIQPRNPRQESDWKNWCPGAKIGEIVNSPLNPILYQVDPTSPAPFSS